MIRRPPRSTLFPSPTLFRSSDSSVTARQAPVTTGPASLSRTTAQMAWAHTQRQQKRRQRVGSIVRTIKNLFIIEIGRAHVELQSQSNLVCRLLLEKKNKRRE